MKLSYLVNLILKRQLINTVIMFQVHTTALTPAPVAFHLFRKNWVTTIIHNVQLAPFHVIKQCWKVNVILHCHMLIYQCSHQVFLPQMNIWTAGYLYLYHLVSTYVVCERLSVMHQQASKTHASRNFWPNSPEHPCSGIWFQNPPPPSKIEI